MKRTLAQAASELEAIKLWLADISDDLTESNEVSLGREVAKTYVKVDQVQEKLKSQCKSPSN